MYLKSLFLSDQLVTIFIFRLILGIVLFPHGMQKLFGWFGGDGFNGTLEHMSEVGLPKAIALLVIIGQSFGSIAIIIGCFTRPVAAGIFIIMLGAMVINVRNGWLMNWAGNKKGEGVEYFVLFLSINLFIIISGSGPYAVDNLIAGVMIK